MLCGMPHRPRVHRVHTRFERDRSWHDERRVTMRSAARATRAGALAPTLSGYAAGIPAASMYTIASSTPSTPSRSFIWSSMNAPTPHAPRPIDVAAR